MSTYSTKIDGTRVRRLTAAETAIEVRAALKTAYPKVKFSVTTSVYSGGASIRVRWTEGPSQKDVDRVAGKFSGATFDGMIDLKSHHDSTLRGERVHFGADYVFCERDTQEEADLRARYERERAAKIAARRGRVVLVASPAPEPAPTTPARKLRERVIAAEPDATMFEVVPNSRGLGGTLVTSNLSAALDCAAALNASDAQQQRFWRERRGFSIVTPRAYTVRQVGL